MHVSKQRECWIYPVLKIIFPQNITWGGSIEQPIQMLKLIDKKIFTTLRSKLLFI